MASLVLCGSNNSSPTLNQRAYRMGKPENLKVSVNMALVTVIPKSSSSFGRPSVTTSRAAKMFCHRLRTFSIRSFVSAISYSQGIRRQTILNPGDLHLSEYVTRSRKWMLCWRKGIDDGREELLRDASQTQSIRGATINRVAYSRIHVYFSSARIRFGELFRR